MRTSDFDYVLPPELIAQEPAARRDAARLMVVRRDTRTIEHRRVADLPDLLKAGDLLVTNNTRVIPARVRATKEATGGKVELFFVEELGAGRWKVLLRARRRPDPGERMVFAGGRAAAWLVEEGARGEAVIEIAADRPVLELLEEAGETPLPPYIQRKETSAARQAEDRDRYQTIFARHPGAVAAPTAGLHFTPDLLGRLAAAGVPRTEITLHVGPGTFRPVSVEDVDAHVMDEERYEIPAEAADAIRAARARGGRIVAVGSTSVRTLETAAARPEGFGPGSGRSGLFIRPPYTFRMVDVMMTNFHLPKSTLLMMVCALAGRDFMLEAYRVAVAEKYRFFSYGDAMLIL